MTRALALLALLLVPVSALGYALNGTKWFPADQPVEFRFNDVDDPDLPGTGELDEARAGFQTWEDLFDSGITFVEGPIDPKACAAGTVFEFDSVNLLTFNDPCQELAGGVLGLTLTTFDPGDTMVTSGTTFMHLLDADIVFDDDSLFTDHAGAGLPGCSDAFDLRAVATHEIGHLIGIGHSEVQAANMYFAIAPCDPGRWPLHPDDQAAANFVYPPPSCTATASAEAFPSALCQGLPVTLMGSNSRLPGCPPVNVEYRWSGDNGFVRDWSADPNAQDTPASDTTYTLEVRCTEPVCTASANTRVRIYPSPVADPGPPQDVCAGGTVTLGGNPTGSGGTPPYSYAWFALPGDPTLTCNTCPNPEATPAATTEYTLYVTDDAFCSVSTTVTIGVRPLPQAEAGPDRTFCGVPVPLGGSPTGSGGTGVLAFEWAAAPPDPTLSCGDCPNPTASPTVATRYTVTVRDETGCATSDQATVDVVSDLVAEAGTLTAFCAGSTATLGGSPTASGGGGGYLYAWTADPPDPSLSCSDCPNPEASPAVATRYTVVVTDAFGCVARDEVTLAPSPAVAADAGPAVDGCPGSPVTIGGSPTGAGGTGVLAYAWSADPADPSMSCVDCPNPAVDPAVTTTYTVVVSDELGCSATAAATVTPVVPDLPPVVGGTVRAVRAGSAGEDLVLDWPEAGGSAVGYDVLRSDDPAAPQPWPVVASGLPPLTLPGEVAGGPPAAYYKVRSVNCAGDAGPP